MTWLTRILPGHAPDGAPILSVLGKRTYRIAHGKPAWPDGEQAPFLAADEPWGQGNPFAATVKAESDLVAYKPMTDVVVAGKAHAPGGRKVRQIDVGIQVGKARKVARIHGDRKVYVTATGVAFSVAEPFLEMPLDYSRAYGGKDERSDPDIAYAFPKNPLGKGFVIRSHPKALQDLALPNVEDAQRPLSPETLALGRFELWSQAPDPVAFGCVGKASHPRSTKAGLTPEDWIQAEAERQRSLRQAPEVGSQASGHPSPIAPMLNLGFFNGASPGLCFPYLRGDEPIRLAHMDAAFPSFDFTLPRARPKAWLDVGEGREEISMDLQTVVLYKDENRMTLVWQGCAYFGGLKAMKDFNNLDFGVQEG